MSKGFVELTQPEINQRGLELADKLAELTQIKAEKKEVINEFKTKIEIAEKEVIQLTESVRSGKEFRVSTFFDDQINDRDEE